MPNPKIETLADPEALAGFAADWICKHAAATSGKCAIALSGGSTPKRLYEILATQKFRDAFPWDRVHWFLGDERFVPHDSPNSNLRMVEEALFSHVPIPKANIHPVQTENTTPEKAAEAYEKELKAYYGAETLDGARPLFDIMLLGMGTDGHTASLFPGTAMLEEQRRWVGAVIGAKEEPRITLTYPVIDSSRETVFLIAGAEKKEILRDVLKKDPKYPASAVHPLGNLRFFIDEAAKPAT